MTSKIKLSDLSKLNRKQLAYVAGVTERTINRWYKEGLPRGDDGFYDTRPCVQWIIDRAIEKSAMVPETQEASEWLEKFRMERYRLARIERREKEKKLMPREEVHREWADRIFVLFSGIDRWISRLSPMLEGKSKDDISLIMKQEIFSLRKTFAEKGRYCPEIDLTDEGKDNGNSES
jgi:hypothetical protein